MVIIWSLYLLWKSSFFILFWLEKKTYWTFDPKTQKPLNSKSNKKFNHKPETKNSKDKLTQITRKPQKII